MEQIDPGLAKASADRAERLADFSHQQFMSMSNWLMASNFAINGAAIVAAFPLAKTNGWAKLALCLFGAGMILAMLNGFAIQQMQALQYAPAEERLALLRRAEVEGSIDREAVAAVEERVNAIYKWAWLPPAFGWLSGTVFVVGGGILAWSL